MKDIIWTLIVVWLIYKVVNLFKNANNKNSSTETNSYTSTEQSHKSHTASHSEKDIKEAVKKHVNKEGDYVDFEEVK